MDETPLWYDGSTHHRDPPPPHLPLVGQRRRGQDAAVGPIGGIRKGLGLAINESPSGKAPCSDGKKNIFQPSISTFFFEKKVFIVMLVFFGGEFKTNY